MTIIKIQAQNKQDAIMLCSVYFRKHGEITKFEVWLWQWFFTCDLPEDTVLLVVKVKTKTGNHTLVEDMETWTEKFRPWKKPAKDGKTSPRKLPGVLSPRKNDVSVILDSGHALQAPQIWSTNLDSLMSPSVWALKTYHPLSQYLPLL